MYLISFEGSPLKISDTMVSARTWIRRDVLDEFQNGEHLKVEFAAATIDENSHSMVEASILKQDGVPLSATYTIVDLGDAVSG